MSEQTSGQLSEIHQEIVLEHARRPLNCGILENATVTVAAENPSCGDQLTLQLLLDGDRIQDIRFTGHGCAICIASTSMMTRAVKGVPCEEAVALFQSIHDGVRDDPAAMPAGDLAALAGVRDYPQRVKCALLPWEGLREALRPRKTRGIVTTDGQ